MFRTLLSVIKKIIEINVMNYEKAATKQCFLKNYCFVTKSKIWVDMTLNVPILLNYI